jgi:GT2 family glycosyltransferase
MELSIIITSYKNPELLRVCIDSIRKNLSLSNYEIIVADSETEEKTELMMRNDYPEIKFIPAKSNIGFAATVRNGYDQSRGDYILIMNGDIIIKKNSVEKLLEYIKNNPQAGIVGPQLLNFNETLQPSCYRFYTPMTIIYRRTFLGKFKFAKKHLDNFLMKDFDHKATKEVDWLMGSVLMTKKEAVKKVGLMDSRYKLYFEDVDWCRRFWESGYKVLYYPVSKMYHYHGRHSARTKKSLIKTLFFNRWAWMHIISAGKYFLKYAGKTTFKHN